jgi:methionyl-tRNA formyltransferase
VPTLLRLLEGPHAVALVVSQPDRPRGRGRRSGPAPVAAAALERGVALLRPEKVGAPEVTAALREAAPDLGVVVAFGQFLPRPVRELPRLGYLINAHASLLPRHRGAAPVAHAILAGDRETGVSVMRVEREMDAGPVALVRRVAIGPDETAGELETRLAGVAADAVAEALARIADGSAAWTPQDEAAATLAPKLGRDAGRLDFREPAAALVRRVRATTPRPGAFTELAGERLGVLAASAEPGPAGAAPGTARRDAAGRLRIATGDGWLVPRVLQRAGGRPLAVDAFLRGRPVADGTRLGGAGA